MAISIVKEWIATVGTNTGSRNITGTATIAGNDLFMYVFTRGTVHPTVIISDAASNAWTLVQDLGANGSVNMYVFRATNAASITSATISTGAITDQQISPYLVEISGMGAVVGSTAQYFTNTPGSGGSVSATTPTAAGQLVLGFGGVTNTNRTWTAASTNLTITDSVAYSGQQTMILQLRGFSANTDPVTVGWSRASGSATDFGVIAITLSEWTPPVYTGMLYRLVNGQYVEQEIVQSI